MEKYSKEEIADKIRKLRDTAASYMKEDNIATAEKFMRAAEKLMSKYSITAEEMRTADALEAIREFEANVKRHKGGKYWTISLAGAIARYNSCKAVRMDYKAEQFLFVGEPHMSETAAFMFEAACIIFTNAAKKAYKAHHAEAKLLASMYGFKKLAPKQLFDKGYLQSDSKFIHGFLTSAASAFYDKVEELLEARNLVPSTRELVVATEALINDYINAKHSVTTNRVKTRSSSGVGDELGAEFGSNYAPKHGVSAAGSNNTKYLK